MSSNKTLRKTLLTELSWLIGIFILSIISQYALSQLATGNNAFDINLHDTYFVVKPTTYYFTDFVFVGFIVYLIRSIFALYKMPAIKLLLMLFNVLLIFYLIPLAFQTTAFIKPNFNGWTIYPPLSALPKVQPPVFNYMLAFKTFVVTEILLILHLCFASICVGAGLKRDS